MVSNELSHMENVTLLLSVNVTAYVTSLAGWYPVSEAAEVEPMTCPLLQVIVPTVWPRTSAAASRRAATLGAGMWFTARSDCDRILI